MAPHKVFHRVHVPHEIEPHELDTRYHGAHAGHDHAPMQPHELDGIDHHMDGKKGIPDPKVNSYDGHPYHYGNVPHHEVEHQPGPSSHVTRPEPAVNQGDSENPYSEGQ